MLVCVATCKTGDVLSAPTYRPAHSEQPEHDPPFTRAQEAGDEVLLVALPPR